MPPVDSWKDWPLQQNALLQLFRRKRARKTLIQPDFDANECIFVHVPKAAGTSLKNTLFPNSPEITHYRALDYFLDNPVKYERYFVFTLVRNPYDRLVSAYQFLMEGGKNNADLKFRNEFLSQYSDFANFVKYGLHRKEIMNKYHFVPQSCFTTNLWGKNMVDFIGRVETIEKDFAIIAQKLGVNVQLPHTNRSQRGHFSTFYTEELRRIAYGAYKTDFQQYGYADVIPEN